MNTVHVFELVMTGSLLFTLTFLAFAVRGRYTILRGASRPAIGAGERGVTILKPCAGVEDGFEACITSFFALEHTNYEILFGVREMSDPAVPVIERVRARFPNVRSSLITTAQGRSLNPKVAQLEVMAGHAHYDVLWISDSNTQVDPLTLTSMLEDMLAANAGIVVSPIVGVGETTSGSALENMQISTFVAVASYSIWATRGLVAAPGKSALITRRVLDKLGGFEFLGRYCAEDNIMVERAHEMGEVIVLGRTSVRNVNTRASMRQYIRRQVRWAAMRWVMVPGAVIAEFFLTPVLSASVWFFCVPSMESGLTFLFCLIGQVIYDLSVGRVLRGHSLRWEWVPWLAFRPFFAVWICLRALFTRKVDWRGNVRWLGDETLLLEESPLRTRVRRLGLR